MWRAFFLAVGITLCIGGGECLVIEKAVLARPKKNAAAQEGQPFSPETAQTPLTREIEPPEWAPWSLLAAGTVVMLYSFTIPRRVNN